MKRRSDEENSEQVDKKLKAAQDEERKVQEVNEALPFPLLMNDIIAIIFEFLPQEDWFSAMLTCKRWYEVGRRILDPSKLPNLRSRLCRLIEKNNLIAIRYLLNEKDINVSDSANLSIFKHAARYGSLETMKELLGHFKHITRGEEVLEIAVELNRVDIVSELTPHIRVIPRELTEMIEREAKLGYLEMCRELLKHPDMSDLGKSLIKAANNNHIEVVKLLLSDSRADPSKHHNEVFLTMVEDGELEIVEQLLRDERLDPSAQDNHAIYLAAENCNLAMAKTLLKDSRVDPFGLDFDRSALDQAIYFDDIDMIKLFMEYEKNHPSHLVRNHSAFLHAALIHAVQQFSINALKLLLKDPRVDLSAQGNEILEMAAEYNNTEAVEILLQDKRVDPSKSLALMIAAQYGNKEIVKILMQDKRVDPSALGNLAIITAAGCGELEIVKLLMQDKRVDPSAQNNLALMYALELRNSHKCLVILSELLKDKRVDVYAHNNQFFKKAMETNKMSVITKLIPDAATITTELSL